MSRRGTALVAFLALGAGGLAAGCMPAAATSQGRAIGDLYAIFLAAGAVVGVLVWILASVAIVRYRHRPGRIPAQTSGNPRVEIVWTLIPLATVLVLFVLTIQTLGITEAHAPDAVQLRVTAFRWQWQATYATGATLIGTREAPLEIVVPVGESIHLTVESLDVNHAFYVPAFLFKRDAIPGRPTAFDFTVDEAGTYAGQCAEFCGVFHDTMTFTVRAVDRAAFEAWLAAGAAPGGPP